MYFTTKLVQGEYFFMSKNILLISSLFPNPKNPYNGLFVYKMLRSMKEDLKYTVIVPIPRLIFSSKITGKEWISFKEKLLVELPCIYKLYYISYYFLPRIFHPVFAHIFYRKLKRLVRQLLQENEFQLIHSHFLFPEGVFAARLGKKFNLKAICTIHGSDLNTIANRFYWKPYFWYAINNLSGLIFVSEALEKKYLALTGNKMIKRNARITVIPNGFADWISPHGNTKDIDLVNILRSQGKKIILFVGNLVKAKRVDILIKAFFHLKENGCNAVLIIIGKGPQKLAIRKIIKDFNLIDEHDVFLMGDKEHKQVLYWMENADILTLTSENEGSPNVIIESLRYLKEMKS